MSNELTSFQNRVSRIATVILLVIGTVVSIAVPIVLEPHARLIAVCILATFFALFLMLAIIQKNPVSMWLAIVFAELVVIELLVINGVTTYAQIYPLYIAIPAIASLVVAVAWRNIRPHVVPMLFFALQSAVFALQASGVVGFAVVLPVSCAILIGIIVYVAIRLTKKA